MVKDTSRLLEILEAALLGPDAEKWKTEPQEKPENYERWLDAQWLSGSACANVANFKDVIYPLDKAKTPAVLKNMWKFVNLVSDLLVFANVFA